MYFLEPPETHAFSLYHDYTESREGVDSYINVVRPGSTVSNPSARVLDTGEPLKTEILKGAAIGAAKIDIGEAVRADTEIVVIRFPPVKKGHSLRLRIAETYTDPSRYRLDGGLLVFVCAEPLDTEAHAARLVDKVLKLRIFADAAGKMNRSVQDVGGGLLVVSQFTLAADTSGGNRPSFTGAAPPALRLRARAGATAADRRRPRGSPASPP